MEDVSLMEMLNAREMRRRLQDQLLDAHKKPLICLTLNIPGPVKVLPGVPDAFETGRGRIETILQKHRIPTLRSEAVRAKTGYEAFYCIDASAEAAKALMISIEDADRLGRLFDIDVLRADGVKVSREELGFPPRRCLLCGEPAHVCSRSRRHSVAELTAEIRRILLPFTIAGQIEAALLAEVSATPKPGLVDLHDNGAHTDMCFDTFAASAGAISPWLARMFETGYLWNGPQDELFPAIRPIGIRAEQAMFAATGGVNTHKGMIFSLGIIAAALGLWLRTSPGPFSAGAVLSLAGELCRDSLEQDFAAIRLRKPATHGEILYQSCGLKGIRGEAQAGFPSIRWIALPAMERAKAAGLSDNDAALDTLLALMAEVDDTNVLIRTGPRELAYAKAEASRILKLGGAASETGKKELALLNERFIQLNLSPGGCADLLAITIFLWDLAAYTLNPSAGTDPSRSGADS